MELLRRIGDSLTRAKDYTAEHYISKELGKRQISGDRGQGSFGVRAATPRMTGVAGFQTLASELIKTGMEKYVDPAIERKFQEIQNNRNLDKHQAKGGRLMLPPSVSM